MPVVYNGVQGSGQGDLFQGLKLWIAHRVPQRDRMIDLVKGNGGEIVKLEKNSDMLIADHLKAGGVSPPPGSYSWQWIDTSVKNGFLEEKDDYLIGRRVATARDAGALESAKVGRTPFTKHDDLILTKWVLAEERKGNPVSGRAVYQALERTNPRHTWQSWRDRWVRILCNRPRPSIPEEELEVEVDGHHAKSPDAAAKHPQPSGKNQPSGKDQPIRPATPSPPVAEPPPGPSSPRGRAPQPKSPSAPPSSIREGAKGRTAFSKEDDRLLLEYIEVKREQNRKANDNEDRDLRGNVIYKAFAGMHPEHTWHSWRDRWVRHLSLLEAVDDAGPDEAGKADPEEPRRRQTRQRPDDAVEVPACAVPASPAPGPSGTQPQQTPKTDKYRLNKKQSEDIQVSAAIQAHAATLVGKTWRGHVIRRDLANLETAVLPLQSLLRGYLVRMKAAERLAAVLHGPASEHAVFEPEQDGEQAEGSQKDQEHADMDSNESQVSDDPSPRDQFWSDLEDIVEATGLEINRTPIIAGRKTDLWELYSIATEQHCEPEERDWKVVAERLGFEPAKSLIRKVQACYLQNLADFEDHIKAFESNDGKTEGEQEVEAEEADKADDGADAAESFHTPSEAVTAPKQPLADAPSPAYRSSPPTAGAKRSFGQSDLLRSDSAFPSSGARKRRRVDRASVIPPTPEDKLGTASKFHSRASRQNDSSPPSQHTITNGQIIELSSGGESDELLDEDLGDIESADELPPLKELPRRERFAEPETQDWHIEQDDHDFGGENCPSPSDQLHLESNILRSPDLALPNRSTTTADMAQASSLTARLRGAGIPNTRILRSSPQPAAVQAHVSSSSRGPVNGNGKVTKRTLPFQYKRKSAAASTSTPVPPKKPTFLQRIPHSNGSSTTHLSSTAPVHSTKNAVLRPTRLNGNASLGDKSYTNPSLAVPHSTPSQPSSSKGVPLDEDPQKFDGAYVNAQFEHFQALGYKERHIDQAMKAATMMRDFMVPALESLRTGRGIPQNERGVWTSQDCQDLRMVKLYERQLEKGKAVAGSRMNNNMRIKAWALEKKHGKQNMKERWQYMVAMREAREA
ncbi:unnamed protein product [Discula destructiva]